VAQGIVDTYDQVVDFFYDANLAEGACFLKLRPGLERGGIQFLIAQLNADNAVAYAQPTLRIKGKTYAFFNAFTLEWKSGVSPEQKNLIMNQAAVTYDHQEFVYRVNLFQIPFFNALNLLAEDLRVLHATPLLVQVTPSMLAELTLAISGCTMGDKIPFSLKVVFSDRIRLDPGSIATINLKPAEIQKELFDVHFDPYNNVDMAAKSPLFITGWMRFYAPGDFLVPPVTIRYTCSDCSGNQVRSINTKEQHFRVSSLIPAKESENKLLVPADLLIPQDKTAQYHGKALNRLMRALLSFAVALGCLGWLIAWRHRKMREKERLRGKSKEEMIAEDIRRLLQEDPQEPHWSYVARLTRLVRDYVTARFQIKTAPTGGSGKVFFGAVGRGVPEQFAPILQRVLSQADEVVALELHSFSEMENYRAEVRKLIDFPTP
jgi:hypothetical protein